VSRNFQHIGIGDSLEVDVLEIAQRPAGVVVHLLVAADVLDVEHRVCEARVRLVHPDDETSFGEVDRLVGIRFRRTRIGRT